MSTNPTEIDENSVFGLCDRRCLSVSFSQLDGDERQALAPQVLLTEIELV